MTEAIIVKSLGLQPYETTWAAMREFTDHRDKTTPDEIWFLEHPPVFTQGQAGKAEHVLQMSEIPVVQTDRGGQITYHGPGQLVVYTLIDLMRRKLTIRELVSTIEQSVVQLLEDFDIQAKARCDAPGVYVNDAKIGSIGLRVRRGASYHGLALNVNMDLKPFSYINPCGFKGLQMTQMQDLVSATIDMQSLSERLLSYLTNRLRNQYECTA